MEGVKDPYKEIRIENALIGRKWRRGGPKNQRGGQVDVTVEPDPTETTQACCLAPGLRPSVCYCFQSLSKALA
jgi:hypothetical protein